MSEEATKKQTPPAQAPAKPQWNCELQAADGSTPPEQWYVGTKLQMICNGEHIEKPLTDYSQLTFPEGQEFALKVLETKVSDYQNAQFVVAPYRAGKFNFDEITLSDGETIVSVKNFNWEIPSVFELKELEGRPRIPYGPHAPMEMSLPWWFWAGVLVTAAILSAMIFRQVRRHLQRKRIIEALASHSTALSPFNQFQKDVRLITRKFGPTAVKISGEDESKRAEQYLDQLDEAFRLYLVRQLLVPALQWSSREVIGEIRRRHRRVFNRDAVEIRRLLEEFDKAKSDKQKINTLDCEQLAHMSRRVSEKIRQSTKGAQ